LEHVQDRTQLVEDFSESLLLLGYFTVEALGGVLDLAGGGFQQFEKVAVDFVPGRGSKGGVGGAGGAGGGRNSSWRSGDIGRCLRMGMGRLRLGLRLRLRLRLGHK
jgi:hypothetical protein